MTAWRTATFAVRASRARPPGRAGEGPRRRTYGAALQQFDELLAAARTAGHASRPVALFYALSQAGRAIAAAHGAERWRLHGHGLQAPALDRPDLLDVRVSRPRQGKGSDDERIDSFGGVAQATQSPLPTAPMALGELWASLAGLTPPSELGRWPRALLVVPDEPGAQKLFAWERLSATVVGFDELTPAAVRRQLTHYPAAADVHLDQPQRLPLLTAQTSAGPGVRLYWAAGTPDVAGQRRTLDRVAPVDAVTGQRWMRPSVGGGAVSELMTWWALLFGLSMLARYEPDGWTAALDYDSSPLAAPLAALVVAGLDVVPELVIAALDAPS
jgi:hypothetical protein